MNTFLRTFKKIVPKSLFKLLQPLYHFSLAVIGVIYYRFPGKHLTVIAITGTKGKTSSSELLNAMFEASGKKTALAGTLRIKIDNTSKRNMYKMTLPGRLFVQHFLRQAVDANCDVAILETTSEGARQFRHWFTFLNGLIFLNISPEHIESHGGFDNYLAAKLSIGKSLASSSKQKRVLVANSDDKHGADFLALPIPEKIPFSLSDAQDIHISTDGSTFTLFDTPMATDLVGQFTVYNIIACAHMARAFGVSPADIAKGVRGLSEIKGRGEKIVLPESNPNKNKQDFTVVVDYAHTPSSLEAIYGAFEHEKKICVLGNTGGGRDTWKRPEMATIADTHCSLIILTNEDPYDEDPMQILSQMERGISITQYEIILDRKEAIHTAIGYAQKDDVVIITGKGTDPYIMGPNGTKEPWSDQDIAREALADKLG